MLIVSMPTRPLVSVAGVPSSDERLKALEAGTEPTDREMQLMRDEVVRGSDQQRCRMKYICFELQLPKVLPNSVPARPLALPDHLRATASAAWRLLACPTDCTRCNR